MKKHIALFSLLVFLTSTVYCDLPDEPDLNEADIDTSESSEFTRNAIDIKGITDPFALWRLLSNYPDSASEANILTAIGVYGRGNRAIVSNMNDYLMEKNNLFREGEHVDYTLVSACISAIMELGNSSSYYVLFHTYCSGYPEVIAFEAYGAMEIIPGNLLQFFLSTIENNPPVEKYTAFRAGINSSRLTVPERGRLAEFALEKGLNAEEVNTDINDMRYAAVVALTSLRWTRANSLAIRNFYRMQSEYQTNAVPKERFIEAIACLGATGNSQAALVLVLQIGLINARTEVNGSYDTEITLAIVRALGSIGDNAAFDHLLYVTNLAYTEEIHIAAREAIDRLKW
ncbi:MAG: hypothetical protein LBI28_02815 [Treponema sp.]|jgi:hypothetical protein|nr:hypothetical protein [Treponema sp.]